MPRTIDKIIDAYVGAELLKNPEALSVAENKKAEVLSFAKQKIYGEIKNEIKQELIREVRREAKKQAEKDRMIAKLNDYRTLLFTGIAISFVIGLSVNQFTVVVDFFTKHCVGYAFWLGVGFLGICLFIYFGLVNGELAKLVKAKGIEQ